VVHGAGSGDVHRDDGGTIRNLRSSGKLFSPRLRVRRRQSSPTDSQLRLLRRVVLWPSNAVPDRFPKGGNRELN
jgi:hypothetical protein